MIKLGANWIEEEGGTYFTIYSEKANKIHLLLYYNNKKYPKEEIEMKNINGFWQTFVSGVSPGQLYNYRVFGKYDPLVGLRFNPNKELLDPYAKAINGLIILNETHYGYIYNDPKEDLSFDTKSSSEFMPKSVVIDPHFEWEDYDFKQVPWDKTIIYETHIKGLTKLMDGIPEHQKGTYSALASEKVINYLKDLGITTVELMPIQHFVDEHFLIKNGLRNYWGYNPIGFFAPECRYSSLGCNGGQAKELKEMINKLHLAGIEVILDIVLNHTAEYNHLGPTLSFKGIDNLTYYLLEPSNPRYYIDYTGTGNTLNVSHPIVTQMILDCLRYWVIEYHIDGFRFDLATVLSRDPYVVNMNSKLMRLITNDPILSRVKLIAEPWDFGPNGFQLGKFPEPWREWNIDYRNTIRKFWRGDAIPYKKIIDKLLGSRDVFNGRAPLASINYVTSHDGFTLEDLVSYDKKHNEANLMNNRDGEDENYSWNCGVEGESESEEVIKCRERRKRGLIFTLMISAGVPMILGGDEISRSQKGNNNAFCQDNEISWYHWDLDERKRNFLDFIKFLIKFRRIINLNYYNQILWLNNDGKILSKNEINLPTNFIAFLIKINNEEYLVIINGSKNSIEFRMAEIKSFKLLLSSESSTESNGLIKIPAFSFFIFKRDKL